MLRSALLANVMAIWSVGCVATVSVAQDRANLHPIRTEWTPLLGGSMMASVGVGLTENLLVGVTGGRVSLTVSDVRERNQYWGVYTGYYSESAATDSSYVKAALRRGDIQLDLGDGWRRADDPAADPTLYFSTTSYQVLFGYQWVWPAGWSVNMALGGLYTRLKGADDSYDAVKSDSPASVRETRTLDTKRMQALRPSGEFALAYVF